MSKPPPLPIETDNDSHRSMAPWIPPVVVLSVVAVLVIALAVVSLLLALLGCR